MKKLITRATSMVLITDRIMTMSEVLPEAEAEDRGGGTEAISEETQLIEDADLMKKLLKDVTQGAKNTR